VEIRARYLQMGAFTLVVLVAGFAFAYWLSNAGALRDRAVYRVRFEGSVAGLQRGSAVLFNGIRVGEVTRLELDASEPGQVHATIALDRDTPVRADTTVSIDFQGLTGSPVIALVGGKSSEPLRSLKAEPPLLIANAGAGQSMSQAARDVLRRLDGLLADNAQPLRSMIGNFETFSGALARNSDRLDPRMVGRAVAHPTDRSGSHCCCRIGQRADPDSVCKRRLCQRARCAMERRAAEARAGDTATQLRGCGKIFGCKPAARRRNKRRPAGA